MYDRNNIFAKILLGEIPSKKVFEDEFCLAFYDINPRAKVHVLVIPKIEVTDFVSFCNSGATVSDFFCKVSYIATEVLSLKHFRLQINNGAESGQEVFHFHIHILSN